MTALVELGSHHLRRGALLGCLGLLTVLAAVFAPVDAHAAAKIQGTVFEDLNYGGGAGRSLAASGGIGVLDARIEAFDLATGEFAQASNIDTLGAYSLNGLNAGSYIVRVVCASVTSSRLGYSPGLHLAVPTFATERPALTNLPVTNLVGGHLPAELDAPDAGSNDFIDPVTFQFVSGPVGYAQTAVVVNVPTSNSILTGIDFGFSFNVVSNTNDDGMGSFRQFLINASGLDHTGLAQDGLTPGVDNAVFMISNGTAAPGLRASNDYFVGGVASVALQSALPPLDATVSLDAQNQPGWSQDPIVMIDGSATFGANGLLVQSPDCVIRGLIVSGFGASGISVNDVDAVIQGNWIGLDATGTAALANGTDGIEVWTDRAIVGGTSTSQRNVVSGNANYGIRIEFLSSQSVVRGNWVGTNATGTAAVPNGDLGGTFAAILVTGDNTTVGGASAAARNLVSGNTGAGIEVSGFANVIRGNGIGVDANGSPLGNGGDGVFVSDLFGGLNLQIGGVVAGTGNEIKNNGGNGIATMLNVDGVSLLRNAIDDNALLGIDLNTDGVTANDPGDADTGPNGLQNFPDVTLARTSEQDVRLQGTFESTANTSFRFELFASPLADASGNGEGARFVAAFNGSTDALGQFAIDTLLTGVVNLGESVSMTATSLALNNTSEFSGAFTSTDAYGIIVSPTAGLVTSEPGDSASFTVVLEYRPSSPVTIGLVSLDPTEGAPAVPSITFTSTDWNIPQTVWVKGVNDFVMDGDQAWTLELQPAVSSDPKYNGRDADDVAVTNTDEDVAGITVAPTGGLATTEAGGSDVFTVQLDTEPVADVVITLATDTATEGVTDVDTLTFTAANWNVPQTVTVAGVNDFVVDGDTPFTIVLAAASSADPNYDTMDPADVFATNTDDDVAGVAFDPVLGLTTDENGGFSTVNVRLTAMPAAAVTFSLASSDTTEGAVSPTSLTFTAADWNVDQVVTLNGVNDVIVDGVQSWTVVTGDLVSSDPIFDTVVVDDLTVDNADNDVADATATPSAGLVTAEDGTPATFTVVLTSMPSAPVTIPVSSDDATEGTISPASLTFTGANWNVPQTVTVTGANDDVDDGDIAFNVVLGAMSSADVNFDGVDPADVSASNTDDDQAGITVAFGTGLTTGEPAATDSFTVVLDSEPTADVTFSLASDDATEGVAAVASLTFTASNWNVPQSVLVTGADDFVMDADQSYTVVLNAASSLDPNYDTLDPTDVPVLNQDDDVAGFTVSAPSTAATTEAGGTVTFTVALTSEPVADVTVPVASSDPTEGTLSPSSLTFTAGNWNVAQTVTLTGVDDAVDDGDISYDATLGAATSTDPNYSGLDPADVTIDNADDDTAGITVSPITGLVTTEAGGTATFTVVLDSEPVADVTVPVSSSSTAEGAVSPASLTFTALNWNVAQTVTVTGVDDAVDDGDIAYTVLTGAATSADPNYDTMDAADVAVSNTDDDQAGINVTPVAGLVTSEAGGSATFTVVLDSEPVADVTIPVSSSATAEGSVSPASLTFTAADWNVAQTVTVTGVDDTVDDGDIAYSVLTGAATSADPNYDTMDAADVAVSNTDDDQAGITVTPVAGLVTTEAGGTATFTIVLDSEPVADVTIPVSSSATAEGTVSPASLTFTALNWNVAQTVTVTGVNDMVDDGDIAYTVLTGAATSTDPNYDTMDAADVAASNSDDDQAGITVTPLTGLVTTEAGGTATFTIVLDSEPVADVTIPVSSSATAEGSVSPASLTFTALNWNVAQTVTVTGVNDAVDDGDIAYTILTGAASSTDPNYDGADAGDVAVSNTDDDTAGITVTPIAGLVTTEAGGTATFTIVLDSEPVADVTIPVSSSATAEGAVSSASLTFTAADWNVAQTVTVTGVDDAVDDGDIAYSILTGAAASADANYVGMDAADVAVSNTDDDQAGITVTPVAGLVTTEAGGTASFTIVLDSEPVADVTLPVSSSAMAEGTVSSASLTFTALNWNVAQTVTVTGVDDAVDDGDIAYTILTGAAASADPNYSGVDAADVAVSNTDDDQAGVTVTPIAGLVTTEAGGTATFTIVLDSEPVADVTVPVSSSDVTEGTVSSASLTFTAGNWNVAQTVTVTGVNDLVQDGDIAYTILTGAATSADPNYSGVDAADVAVSNTDDDQAGITVTPVTGLVTTEAGGTATFTIVLDSQPVADVTIPVSSSATAEGTVSSASLTFTTADWNVAQTVTVTGVDDAVDDGDIAYSILTGAATSTDPNYSGVDAADVAVSNTDDDQAGITVAPVAGLVTTEAGGTATFTVVLQSQPVADVTVPVSSSDVTEGTVSSASLTFTAADWNVAQTVTVTGVNDLVQDGSIAYSVVTGAATSTDPNYSGVDAADVAASNTDDDQAGITVVPVAGLVTTEAGGTATFTVVLNSEPVANVTVPVSSSDVTEGTVSPASLTFTAGDWNVAQTVTVTGVDDLVQDGSIAYSIVTGAATSADPNYSGVDAADVAASNTDDDQAGITVAPVAGLVTTEAGGTATFTVVLRSEPVANVTVPVSSSDVTEGTVSPASLTFTAADWNVAQTVTVTGVNDLVQDGDIAYTIVTGSATSTDPNYSGVNAADVAVSNTDDDQAGITVTPVAGLVTTEAGGTASFSVVLQSQPVANVTIPVSSSDVTEGTVSPASLTFTAADWNVAQTVTVTGANDLVQDGAIAYTVVTGAATSTDPNYSGANAADVAVSNTDDDQVGITVTPVAGLVTTEAGGSATFTVVLHSQPVANVTVPVTSTDLTEGSVSPASLTFTAANWNVAQTVTVTGANDFIQDGTVAWQVAVGPATSTDPLYLNLDAADVSVTTTDDDAVGITVTPVAGLSTTEAGGTATYTVVLQSQPVAIVTIPVTVSDATEGSVTPSNLVFTAANWNVAQTVTVTGANDPIVDGDQPYTVLNGPAVSTDPLYSGLVVANVSVMNVDDVDGSSVTMELVPDRTRVTQGQPVGWRLSVRNRTGEAIDNVTITHQLPAMFAALKGTTIMNGMVGTPGTTGATPAAVRQVLSDAVGGLQNLTIPQLPAFVDGNGDGIAGPGEAGYVEFRWQLVPGAGAKAGRYSAQVTAVSGCATCTVAMPTSASVEVQNDELFSRSTLLGRVFEDRDRDGEQSSNEPGVAGARLVMDDGTTITSDSKGLFHVPDLESGPRAIKMDLSALGAGAVATTGVSQVVDLGEGLLGNVRFGVAFPKDTVSVGREGVNGLAVVVRDGQPFGTLDLAGSLKSSKELKVNGVPVTIVPTEQVVTSADRSGASVTLGDLEIPVDARDRFETTIPNRVGDSFEVEMVDRSGRKSVARVRLPRLQVTSPQGETRLPFGQSTGDLRTEPRSAVLEAGMPLAADEATTGNSPVAYTTLRGVTDAGATVTVNGQGVSVGEDGSFMVEVPLRVGRNDFALVAKDASGLVNTTTRTIEVADRDANGGAVVLVEEEPALTLYLPPKGVALQSPALGLAGRTRPGHRVTVNGTALEVRSDGSFSHNLVLAEGMNTLTFEVTDPQGRASVVKRDLEVRSPGMFLVALADGVVGQSSGASFLRKSDSKTYTEGRVAWNLRGWVAGRYLLTSAFDSQRRDWGSMFKDLDDNGRDRLLTQLDPDKLYPVFGDSAGVRNSELNGGRLYVGLEGDAVKASLGNFPIALDQVELAGFRRTLYGAQVRVGETSGNKGIPSGTSLALFGAQASHIKVRDVLDATGGSLYYLSHTEVLQGSTMVTLVVRDRITGLPIARVPQRPGVDVIIKEYEGRLQFTRPVSSVWNDGGLVGDGDLQGHPVSIEVDYETRGNGAEKSAVGGRVTQALGRNLQVGTTIVDDQSGGGEYRLRGTDFTAMVAKGTRVTGEIATSSGRTGRAFSSTDGGIGYAEMDSVGAHSGLAWKTAAEVDLGEFMGKPGVANVSGYVRRVESGFLSDGEREGMAADRSGFRAQVNAGRYGRFSTRYDHESRPASTGFNSLRGSDLFGLQWRMDEAKRGFAAEFEQRDLRFAQDRVQSNSTGAARVWWKPVDRVKTTVEHQQTLAGDSRTTTALAVEWLALSNLSLEARGSSGALGNTLRGSATVTLGDKQIYLREERTDAASGVRGGTLFGVQAPLGPESRVYSEYQWQRDPMGDHGVSVTGLEQAWRTSSGFSIAVAGEHGTRGGRSGQHGSVSGMLSYKGRLPVSGSTRAEARRMQGTAYTRQMLSSTRLELALPSGFTVMTDLRMSLSRRGEAIFTTPNRYTESSIGLAWRAPRSDAFQAIARWTRLADERAAGAGDTLGLNSVLGVAAVEATTRLAPGVEWAVKGATRLSEDGRPGQPSAVAHSSIVASRVDYRIRQQPFRLGVEYRVLSQREASDQRTGWLNELSYDANQNMRFGVGYNFSRFSGDPLVREQASARGWFLRAQSRY